MAVDVVVIGASSGGLHALQKLLGALPADLPVPVAVVQHRHRDSDDSLLSILRSVTPLQLLEPDDKEPLRPAHVYFAPPDYHLLLAEGGCELSTDAPVSFARPSVDVLFESAADAFGAGVLAVVLTGANSDGVEGARRVQAAGGMVVVQDATTAEAPQMPQAVIDAGVAHHVLPLEGIAPLLIELCATGDGE
jgi:two-component system, chemotaxis family, protein-glutamate methylesterase/glutaminase